MFWSVLGAIALGFIIGFAIYMILGCFHNDQNYTDYDNDQTKK